jgi:hypothetical protein
MKCPNHEAAGYDTDLTNAEWELIEPLFYPAGARRGRGRRREAHAARASPGAIRYILKAGCQWSLLPKDFPPESLWYLPKRESANGTKSAKQIEFNGEMGGNELGSSFYLGQTVPKMVLPVLRRSLQASFMRSQSPCSPFLR